MAAYDVDWQIVKDPFERRKLQNRINQRLSRQRRAKEHTPAKKLVIKQWKVNTHGSDDLNLQQEPPAAQGCTAVMKAQQSLAGQSSTEDQQPEQSNSDVSSASVPVLELTPRQNHALRLWNLAAHPIIAQRHAERLQRKLETTGIPHDGLLTLTYYNVIRGFSFIVDILGLDISQICLNEYPSPFLPLSPTANSAITKLPAKLRPTPLQCVKDHHAYMDIFPCPVVRDNLLLRNMSEEEEAAMCMDLMGCGSYAETLLILDDGAWSGTSLWGDPWDAKNWEVSENMAVKWAWVWKGAFEMQEATNSRRRARGWKEIYFA